MTVSPHILILGFGSVGKRHARNLSALGCRISCVDIRADRAGEQLANVEIVARYQSLDEAMRSGRFDAAVVATPTLFHVEQAVAMIETGLPVLLEKPVSPGLAEARLLADRAAARGVPVLLGYTWRWWPALRRVRELLAEGRLGRIVRADFWMSAHLEDWHPGEPLTEFFMSSKHLGGGALLDESHWLDQMLWLFGMPDTLYGTVDRVSDLPIDSDDMVDVIARYRDGKQVSVHLDLIGRPHKKRITILGLAGTLTWSAADDCIRVSHSAEPVWTELPFSNERNDMFMALAREFMAVVSGTAAGTCTLQDGLQVMRMIEAVRIASANGRDVRMAEI